MKAAAACEMLGMDRLRDLHLHLEPQNERCQERFSGNAEMFA